MISIDVARFLVCVNWYHTFGYFSAMAGDDNGLQGLSTRMGTAERRIDAIKSTLNGIV